MSLFSRTGDREGTPVKQRKPLLVASVFAPSERNSEWLRLQREFLERTSPGYEHGVFLNRLAPDLFKDSIIIGSANGPQDKAKHEHSRALNQVIAYFRQHPEYENFLILDSDAFPVRPGWTDLLLHWMSDNERLGEKHFAAAVRTENLDTFPHPCAFFIRGKYLHEQPYDFTPQPRPNLSGHPVSAPGATLPTVLKGQHVFLPLIRSNFRNVHPILGALYGGLFYHHGCGSRDYTNRSQKLGYFDHLLPGDAHARIERELYERLTRTPDLLLRELAA